MTRLRCSAHAAAFVVVSLAPSVAAASDVTPDADDRPLLPGHLQLAFRAGLAIPTGRERSGIPLSDLYYLAVPLTVEAGYRQRWLYLGGAFSVAPGVVASDDSTCNQLNVSCAREDFQLTFGGRFYGGRPSVVATWVGVSLGWEISATHIGGPAGGASGFMDGPLGALEVGVDAPLGRSFTLGPYLGVALGRYVHRTQSPEPVGFSTSIDDGANHTWIGLGVRGAFAVW